MMSPLRRVLRRGRPEAGEFRAVDFDWLECGHRLTAARDIVGRRFPARRRYVKCASDKPADWKPTREDLDAPW